jgi:hypothetical protein
VWGSGGVEHERVLQVYKRMRACVFVGVWLYVSICMDD